MAMFAGRRRIASDFAVCTALFAGLVLVAPAVARADASRGIPPQGIAERIGVADVRIERDPETGGWQLGSLTKERELATFDASFALNHSHEGLVTRMMPGGRGFTIDLLGRFQSYSVARFGADGAVETNCDENPLSLYRWLVDAPAPVDGFGRPTR